MANISNAVNMSFRVDKDLKKQADILFKKLGMNTSVALNMFLTQSVLEQGIPFQPSAIAPTPSKKLKKALQEGEDILSGKLKEKGYHDVEKLVKDILD